MGKGKKKGGKKTDDEPKQELEAAVSTLIISEGGPSTSGIQAPVASVAEPVAAPPAAAPASTEPLADDDDEGGLGLGKSRRQKRPRKKKALSSAPAEGHSQPAAVQQFPVEVEASGDSAEAPAPSFWGPRQPTGFAPRQAPPAAAPPGFESPKPGQPEFPSHVGQTGFPVAPGPTVFPSISGQAGFGSQQQPGPSRFQETPSQSRSQPVWSAGPPPGQSAGRGAGPPPGQSAGRGAGPPPGQSSGRGAGPGKARQESGAAQARPGPYQPVSRPQAAPLVPVSYGDTRRTPPAETTIRRFQIPNKIPSQGRVQFSKIRVITNYLPMTIKYLKIHRYDVTFKPDKPKKMIPKAFIEAKKKMFPHQIIAFDQMKNCYVLHPLKGVTQERSSTTVELLDNNGRTISFEVSFKATGTVDLDTIRKYMQEGGTSLSPPTEAIQCIDVILRQGTLESYIKAGRQFFKRPSNPIDLGDGLEMWTGLFQSAIFTSSAFVNIDVAHKGFPRQQPLIEAISRDFGLSLDQPIDRQRARGVENFLNFIKGLRVIATIGGDKSAKGQKREFICNELVKPPSELSFMMTNAQGKQQSMTVAEYFSKEKHVRLRYPNLNCMWVGPRDKNIYYPMELLEISYGQVQARNKQLNEMQLSKMVREAATPPNERKKKIEEVIRDMNYSRNPEFKSFGLEISNEFFQVEAKVLAAPVLDTGGRTVVPSKGAWQASRLLKPEALESWVLIAIDLDMSRSNGEEIISLLKKCGTSLGMRVNEPRDRFYNTAMKDLRSVLLSCLDKGYRFLVIIVPTRGKDYYHKVKQMAERDVGILTQCIKEYTACRRMNQQTAKNILLKVNSKLMGINQALDKHSIPKCLDGKCMVVGADVTHPSPDQSSVPSIAAVTASIDPKCFIYNIQLSIQTPKKEMILEFEDMMVEHFKVYRKSNQNELPKKIFVFRDGVSEGQFAEVMNSELQAVHRAYQRMSGTPTKPEVLFLLVQKRHHTRLFNADPHKGTQNVDPGTVVDTHIVHAKELDFYLVSHQAIKGTARPTRYHAVCNDGKIPLDEVEQLTYYLCHLYSRCMRAVSYPTPTYYAHLACLRARSLTHGQKFNNAELEKHPQRLLVLDKMLESSRMFFV